MVNQFGVNIAGTTSYGYGTVLAEHPITHLVVDPYLAKNGQVTAPDSATELIQDYYNAIGAIVMEQTTEIGLGRLFVIGDSDMFSEAYMSVYPQNQLLARNIANWAMDTGHMLVGHVDLADFAGTIAGHELTLELYDGDTLVETVVATLDEFGDYVAPVSQSGVCDVRGKVGQWLAVRQDAVNIAGETPLSWTFLKNGDANHDNEVNLFDLNLVLLAFGLSGPNDGDLDENGIVAIQDLNITLLNFSLVGD